ncbi:hypothetical protein MASR2M39_27770 [Ignavibacteriales bacterium]
MVSKDRLEYFRMQNGEELKTTIKDMNGKIAADATSQFTANYDGEWAKVTDCLKFSPTGHPSTAFDKLPYLPPANINGRSMPVVN